MSSPQGPLRRGVIPALVVTLLVNVLAAQQAAAEPIGGLAVAPASTAAPRVGTPTDAPLAFTMADATIMPPPVAEVGSVLEGGFDIDSADLNGDGLDDVVAIRYANSFRRTSLGVAFGLGDGTLDEPNYLYLGDTSNDASVTLAIDDIDGDDTLDILVALQSPDEVRIFYNDGAGNFSDTGDAFDFIPLDDRPWNLDTADLDADGDVDVVVNQRVDGKLTVYDNLGGGTFDTGTAFPISSLSTFALDDLDDDGKVDILVGRIATNDLGALMYDDLGDADPANDTFTFVNSIFTEESSTVRNVFFLWAPTHDVTGDGIGDIIAVNRYTCDGAACLFVAAGVGDGTFELEPYTDEDDDNVDDGGRWANIDQTLFFSNGGHQGLADPVMDADGDGRFDVLFGTIQAPVYVASFEPGQPIEVLSLVPSGGAPPEASIASTINGASGNDGRPVIDTHFVDLDDDGRHDILTILGTEFAGRGDPDMTVIRADASIPWGYRTGRHVNGGTEYRHNSFDGTFVDLVDWDGDGALDLVGVRHDGSIVTSPGNGDGTFGDAVVLAERPATGVPECADNAATDLVTALQVTDLDQDGALDIVYRSRNQARNLASICSLYGDGAGGIAELEVETETGVEIRSMLGAESPEGQPLNNVVVHADYDGDGDLDTIMGEHVAADGGTETFTLFRANGPEGRGHTVERLFQITETGQHSFAVGDLDGVNGPDLAFLGLGESNSRNFYIYLQQSDGTLATPSIVSDVTASTPFTTFSGLTIGDLDGDGNGDLVGVKPGSRLAGRNVANFVYRGLGDGTVENASTELTLSNRGQPTDLVDIDRDGDLDLVSASRGFGLDVALNNGFGTIAGGDLFDGPYRYPTTQLDHGRALIGDLDGDGDLDAVMQDIVLSAPFNSLTVLLQVRGPAPAGDAADLRVTDISVDPVATTAGDTVDVTYTVVNEGIEKTLAGWTDSIYLSDDAVWDIGDRRVGEVVRRAPLDPESSITNTVTVDALPVLDGDHHVIVRTDARNRVPEADETDNTTVAADTLDIDIPLLTPDGSLDLALGDGDVRYVQIPVADGEPLAFTYAGPASSARIDIVRNAVPVPRRELVVGDPGETTRRLALPEGDAGTWFVRIEGLSGADGSDVTVSVAGLAFGLIDVDPNVVGDNGPATVRLIGAGLADDTTVTAVRDDETHVATSVNAADDGRSALATFTWGPLSDGGPDVTPGDYDLVATAGAGAPPAVSTLSDGLRVIDRTTSAPDPIDLPGVGERVNPCTVTGELVSPGDRSCDVFSVTVASPTRLRALSGGLGAVGTITYQNRALVDIPRPLVELRNYGVELTMDGGETYTIGNIDFEIPNEGAPDDVLPAGAKGRIEFRVRPTGQIPDPPVDIDSDFSVSVGVLEPYSYRHHSLTGAVSAIESEFATRAARGAVAQTLLDTVGGGTYFTTSEYVRRVYIRDEDGNVVLNPTRAGASARVGAEIGEALARTVKVIICDSVCRRYKEAAYLIPANRATNQHDYLVALHAVGNEAAALGAEVERNRAWLDALLHQKVRATADGASLTGTVTVDGSPSDAEIVAVTTDDGKPEVRLGSAWFDGSYNVWELPADRAFEIRGEGLLPRPAETLAADRDAATEADLALRSGGIVSGAVSGSDGPVVDEPVRVFLDDGTTAIAVTDEAGSYRITGLPIGEHRIGVDLPGRLPFSAPVSIPTEETDLTIDVLIEDGATITGSVTSADGPVAGASVTVRSVETGGDRATTTDGSGSYAITGLEDGPWTVIVTAPGFGLGTTDVDAAEGAPATGDVSLDPEAVVELTVTDAGTGEPVTDAFAAVELVDGLHGVTGAADAAGSIILDGLPAGDLLVQVSSPDHITNDVEVTTTPGETITANAAMLRVTPLSGRIVDDEGEPLVVGVEIVPAPGLGTPDVDSTDADGNFTLPDVYPGDHQLLIGGAVAVDVTQEADSDVGEITVDVSRISGSVTDGTDPLARELVLLSLDGEVVDRTVTDDDGNYEFLALGDGAYTVTWLSEAFGAAAVEVDVTMPDDVAAGGMEPGSSSLTVDLSDVSDAADAAVLVIPTATSSAGFSDDAMAGVILDGEPTTFDGLTAGEYRVEVTLADHAPFVEIVEIGEEDAASVEATLLGGVLVEGAVSLDGEPAAYVDITASATDGGPAFGTASAESGRFEAVAAPGTYDIVARLAGIGVARANGVVIPAEAPIELVLDTGNDVGVTLDGALPSVLADPAVVLSTADGVPLDVAIAADVAEDGAVGLLFDTLAPGDYLVDVRVPGATTSDSVSLSVPDDDSITVAATPAVVLLRAPPPVEIEAPEAGPESSPARASAAAVAAPAGFGDPISGGPDHGLITANFSIFRPVDAFRAGMDRIVNGLVLGIPKPERDEAAEAAAEEMRAQLEAELSKTSTQRLSKCRSLRLDRKATVVLDARKDILFEKWQQAYSGVTDYIAIPLLEFTKILGVIAGLTVAVIELSAVLGSGAAASYVTANAAAFGTFGTLGLVGAVTETLSVFVNNTITAFQSGSAQETIKSMAGIGSGLVDGFLSEMSVIIGQDGTFLTRDNIKTGLGALKGRLDAQIDEIVDANKVAEQTGEAIETVRSNQAKLRAEKSLARAQRKAFVDHLRELGTDGDKSVRDALSKRIVEAEVRLSKIDTKLGDAGRQLKNLKARNASALAKLKSIPGFETAKKALSGLAQAASIISDAVKLGDSLISTYAEFEKAANDLRTRSERNDDARLAYLNAVGEYQIQIYKTRHELRKPGCKDPDDDVEPRDEVPGSFATSSDPNEILGPDGAGDDNALAGIPANLDYTIFFENLGPGSEEIPEGQEIATAAAARVTIETELDADVDPLTVTLDDVAVGEHVIDVPDGLSAYQTQFGPVDDPGGEPGQILIDVDGAVDGTILRWVITAIDPDTGYIVGDLRGLLPPEDGTDIGKGSVAYRVEPAAGAATGTVVTAKADIVFDENDVIPTNTWTNVFDTDLPEATITGATSDPVAVPFEIPWVGSDPTTEVASVDVYARLQGTGAFVPVKTDVTSSPAIITSDDLRGDIPAPGDIGLTLGTVTGDASGAVLYDFAVVARDVVGNTELPPLAGEATYRVAEAVEITDEPDPVSAIPFGSSRADRIYRLYEAAFGRPPDTAGLTYWANTDLTVEQIAGFFVRSPEFTARYGDLDDDGFVRRLYRNILRRSGEQRGIDYWVSVLARGTDRALVLVAFADSTELILRLRAPFPQGSSDLRDDRIFRLYRAAFNRPADAAGLRYWDRTGLSLADIAAQFVASPEFTKRYGALSDDAFVRQLYRNILGREGDASGIRYWSGLLGAGTSRGDVLLGFADSSELKQRIQAGN